MSQTHYCNACFQRKSCIQILPGMPVYVCDDCSKSFYLRPIAKNEIENAVSAPWQTYQVESLADYQASNSYIPFTCDCFHRLVASNDGLECPDCGTQQFWTYDWTLDWSWKNPELPHDGSNPAWKPPPLDPRFDGVALKEPIPNSDDLDS